jgi:uncharacterized delta-60 repeat protein
MGIIRLGENGGVDPSFGANGRLALDPGLSRFIVDPAGRIVAFGASRVGEATSGRSSIAVRRFLPGGQPDTSFGGGTLVTTSAGATDDEASAAIAMTSGEIVIAGSSMDRSAAEGIPYNRFVVVKYRADGTLDTSFGDRGKVVAAGEGLRYWAERIALWVQPDGSVITGGMTGTGMRDAAFALVRFGADGKRDASFGQGGIARLENSAVYVSASAVAGDRIATTGFVSRSGDMCATTDVQQRFTSTGAVDEAFGQSTHGLAPCGSVYFTFRDVATLPDGGLLLAGGGRSASALYRVTRAGALDHSFGQDGAVVTALANEASDVASEGIASVAVRDDGAILALEQRSEQVGYDCNRAFCGSVPKLALVRYTSQGAVDTSFPTSGPRITH